MASYDGTNKSSAGGAQHLPYWEIKTEYTKNLYNEAMGMASQEAVEFCNPDGYNGPDIEVDASTLTSDQWQARRANHLGGSDISAIFGENHFKTNLDLYYAKTGKQPLVPEEETAQSRLNKIWGHISEEYVDAWLSERYPYNDIITDTNIYAMPGKPYITANIDRMMRKPDGSYCLVEIKTTSTFNRSEWENGNIPIPYTYQVRTYMAILGVWECVVVCMFDRDTLIANTIKRDLDEEMRIIQGCDEFWMNHVIPHIPPEPIGAPEATLKTIHKYAGDADKKAPSVALGADFAELCEKYSEKKAQRDAAKRTFDKLDEECKDMIVPFAAAMGKSVLAETVGTDGTRWLLKYSPRMSRASVDMQKLEALYPKAYKDCFIPQKESSRVFTLKAAKS